MPSRDTRALYSEIVLPKLERGPHTIEQLQVPRYALKLHRLWVTGEVYEPLRGQEVAA
jgi:hypothetical protein